MQLMKFNKLCLIVAAMFLVVNTGCKKKTREIGPVSSKLEGINDVWVLQQVKQFDPLNKDMVLDVSEAIMGTTPIEMTVDSKNLTYTFNQNDPIYMGTAGNWKFDDENYPTAIEFTEGSKINNVKLIRTIRTVDQTLELQLTRFCGAGKPITVYQFIFGRK
jgi:hypothetical protein